MNEADVQAMQRIEDGARSHGGGGGGAFFSISGWGFALTLGYYKNLVEKQPTRTLTGKYAERLKMDKLVDQNSAPAIRPQMKSR